MKRQFDIEKMRASCRLASSALDLAGTIIRPGVTTGDIDRIVHNFIVKNGGYPAPLNYRSFPKSVCTSINDVVCHGIPGQQVLNDGDIINVDVTTILDGHFGDTSATFFVGDDIAPDVKDLVIFTNNAMHAAIDGLEPGACINVVAHIISGMAHRHGYSVVSEFGGHGIGTRFHTDPHVNHCNPDSDVILVPGMCLTIEPMINLGAPDITLSDDGWTVSTADGKHSAQWEHTVLITTSGVEILTNSDQCRRL